MRFLCLHGLGTNSDILKTQTASLRYRLDETQHEFDFVDGSLAWPPARGIAEVFGEYTDCYSFFDSTASSILEAAAELGEYVEKHGPFDGVLGFSQGAVLAATLVIALKAVGDQYIDDKIADRSQPAQRLQRLALSTPRPFKCAIFLCGGLPFDLHALLRGEVGLLDSSTTSYLKPLIHIPVVNCWASNDKDYPGMGPGLSSLCSPAAGNLGVVHETGHGVPSEGDGLDRLVEAVMATLGNLERQACGETVKV